MKQKRTKLLRFQYDDERTIELPVALLIGSKEGPDVAITAGINGCEKNSVLAAIKLLRDLSSAEICGSVKILTLCNIAAFNDHTFTNSLSEDKILNRSFPGSLTGSYNKQVAAKILDEIKGADCYIDLHSGAALVRSTPIAAYHRGMNGHLNDSCHQTAFYSGIPNIVITESESHWGDDGTAYSSVYEHIGIPSVLFTTGGTGGPSNDNIDLLCRAVKNVLTRLGVLRGIVRQNHKPRIFEGMERVKAKVSGIHINRVTIGDFVKRGQIISVIADYFGNIKEKITSPIDGMVLSISESPAIREDDVVASVGIIL